MHIIKNEAQKNKTLHFCLHFQQPLLNKYSKHENSKLYLSTVNQEINDEEVRSKTDKMNVVVAIIHHLW